MQSTYEQVRMNNLAHIFKIELDTKGPQKINPNFHKNSQDKLMKRRLPKLTLVNTEEIDNFSKKK